MMPKAARTLKPRRPHPKRDTRSKWHRMYNTRKWAAASRAYRKEHPYCNHCGSPSQAVDHIKPHEGDWSLFWDERNWQALCLRCHGRKDGARGT